MNFGSYLSLSNKTTLSVGLFSLLLLGTVPVKANDFIDDACVTGNIFSWNRYRESKSLDTGKYKVKFANSTFIGNIDVKSGYFANLIGLEIGIYGAADAINRGYYSPNEASFSKVNTLWDEKNKDSVAGASLYKAHLNLKFKNHAWLKAGYIQPSGNTLLKTQKNVLPGTYRGAEIGTSIDFASYGRLAASYIWVDQYKSPWYKDLYGFRYGFNNQYEIDYLHSVGFKYDFKNDLFLDAAFGQSHHYMNQYFAKVTYKKTLFNHPLWMNYQFYGAQDQNHAGNKAYDHLAWMQVVSLKYHIGAVTLQTDGKIIQAEGNQGYFLKRMTPKLNSSEGRLDAWWDLRSNFNANGERIIFSKLSYDLGDLNHHLQGLKTASSFAYGWNAKPNNRANINQSTRINELAWGIELAYQVQTGLAKDTMLQLHYINYNNNSHDEPVKVGFGNIFQDERELKFVVTVPFTVFSPAEH